MKQEDLREMLIFNLINGTCLDLTPKKDVGVTSKDRSLASWEKGPEVQADLIRDLLRGHYHELAGPDPHGLTIIGAKISGRLDLQNLRTEVALELKSCYVPQGINLKGSELAQITLDDSIFGYIDGDTNDSEITLDSSDGQICFESAIVNGDLGLSGIIVSNRNGPAVDADTLFVGGTMNMDNSVLRGTGDRGVLRLTGATVSSQLSLCNSESHNPTGPAISADELTVGGNLFIEETELKSATSSSGCARFIGATIEGQFSLTGSNITNGSGQPFIANRITVKSDMFLEAKIIAENCEHFSAASIIGGDIGGLLSFSGAEITSINGAAFTGFNLTVNDEINIDKGFISHGRNEFGSFSLVAARVGGSVNIEDADFRNECGAAVMLDGAKIGRSIFLSLTDQTRIIPNESKNIYGGISLIRAVVGDHLKIQGIRIDSRYGPAINAEGANIGGDLSFTGGSLFETKGEGSSAGTVRIAGAIIRGDLEIKSSSITNDSHSSLEANGLSIGGNAFIEGVSPQNGLTIPSTFLNGCINLKRAHISGSFLVALVAIISLDNIAINAEGIVVDGDLKFSKRTQLESQGMGAKGGTFRLANGTVGGKLDFSNVVLKNDSGPAITASGADIRGGVFFEQSRFVGRGKLAALRFLNSKINFTMNISSTVIVNETGVMLNAEGLNVSGSLILANGVSFECDEVAINRSQKVKFLVNLKSASVSAFSFTRELINKRIPLRRWAIDGFVFGQLNVYEKNDHQNIALRKSDAISLWHDLLTDGTAEYTAQPYQQLAKFAREAGYEHTSKNILISRRSQQFKLAGTSRWERIWGRVYHATIGYGYKPIFAVMCLAGLFVLAVILTSTAHYIYQEDYMHVAGSVSQPCSFSSQLLVAVEVSFPLISTGVNDVCKLSSGDSSLFLSLLVLSLTFLKLAGWVLAALLVAGFAGVIRRDHFSSGD